MADKQQCEITIFSGRGWTNRCVRKAVVQRGDKWYCKIHDPEYIAEKKRKWDEKFDKEWAEKKVRWHRAEVIEQLIGGFDTTTLERNLSKIREFISTIKD